MKSYKHLFFDLDQTLWDHDANANETLEELYREFRLDQQGGFASEDFRKTFHQVNHGLWHDYHLGKVDKDHIRGQRFKTVMELLGVPEFADYIEMGSQYLELCPRKGNLIPYALEILDYLGTSYPMTIITNGFDEIQDIKLSSSGILKYFDAVVTSEKAGMLKPHKEIFDFAVNSAAVSHAECVMIGDNPVTDIGGARDSGIDQIYFNSRRITDPPESTYQIESLLELRDLL